MQKNSNQQNQPLTIRARRQQFRTQIRRQQLQQYFRKKRIQYFFSSNPNDDYQYYKGLSDRIQRANQTTLQEIEPLKQEVIDLFDKFPDQDWNYFVLAGLVLKIPEQILQFQRFVMTQTNTQKFKNKLFAYCLKTMIIIICCEIQDRENPSYEQKYEWIQFVDRADQFLSILIQKMFNNFTLNDECLECISFYIGNFRGLMISTQNEEYFPIFTFDVLIRNLLNFYKSLKQQKKLFVRNLMIDISEIMVELIQIIKKKGLYDHSTKKDAKQQEKKMILSEIQVQSLIKSGSEIFNDNFKDRSELRDRCCEQILKLCEFSNILSGEYIFTSNNISQFQYLMINLGIKTRQILLKCFDYVLVPLRKSKIIQMLDKSFHVNIVTVLKESIEECGYDYNPYEPKHSQSLLYTMKVITTLLQRVSQMEAYNAQGYRGLVRNVVSKMDQNGFGNLLERMLKFRYTQQIQKYLNDMIDDYFSEDMCQQQHFQNINNNIEDNYNHYDNSNQIENQYQFNNRNNYTENNQNFSNLNHHRGSQYEGKYEKISQNKYSHQSHQYQSNYQYQTNSNQQNSNYQGNQNYQFNQSYQANQNFINNQTSNYQNSQNNQSNISSSNQNSIQFTI